MQQDEIRFEHLLDTVKAVNLKDKARCLGDCINDELEEALRKVNEYKKDAEITIKIKINTGGKNELNILADITSKAPKGKIRENIFYQDSKGALYLDDPSQLKLLDARRVENINERRVSND